MQMKILKNLTDVALLQETRAIVLEERKLTTSIFWHLHDYFRE